MKIIPSRVVSEQFHSLLLLLLFHDRVGRALPPSLPPSPFDNAIQLFS